MYAYSNNGLSMRTVDPDYEALAGEVLFTGPATTDQLSEAFPSYSASQLIQVKASKTALLSAACGAAIVAGFSSNALGAVHTYPSSQMDQLNLTASVLASLIPNLPSGWTTSFWCQAGDGSWALQNHTAAQIQQVGLDGKAAISTLRTKLDGLRVQINSAKDAATVNALSWS